MLKSCIGDIILGIYASFMRAINITVSGENVEADDIHECCLIYVSPMPVLNDSVDQDGIEKVMMGRLYGLIPNTI